MRVTLAFLLAFITVMLSSCGVVEGIFKAGMWWAFILMGIAIVFILWLISKFRRK